MHAFIQHSRSTDTRLQVFLRLHSGTVTVFCVLIAFFLLRFTLLEPTNILYIWRKCWDRFVYQGGLPNISVV